MTLRGRLYALLITSFTAPFLVGGLILGFITGERLQQAGFIGPTSWTAVAVDLALAALGIYLGGLIAYIVALLLAAACFSRAQIEQVISQLPQNSNGSGGGMLRKPLTAVSDFFWARIR